MGAVSAAKRLHLLSEHCNGAALDLTDAEADAQHEHEHDGPCTIRDHPRESLHWDSDKAAAILVECLELT